MEWEKKIKVECNIRNIKHMLRRGTEDSIRNDF
jgi:hypothetical protein